MSQSAPASSSSLPAHPRPHPGDRALVVRDRLVADGAVMCIRQDDADRARAGCLAAVAGGLRTLEITLTTPGALELIAEFAPREDLLVGAGTVLAAADVERVAEAGGRFALSPVFDPAMLDAARAHDLLAIPGAATPTEILAAWRAGAPIVKFFPSGPLGGPAALRAIRGPLPHIPLLPTSGPTIETMPAWFAAGATAVGVGGEVLAAGWDEASATDAAHRTRAAVDAAMDAAGRPAT
jgi:2-dehydro-3-deoxyphosphogluconate aldolase/(4S)-4-hydroxy-2-oxoglutarate aldolase